MEPEHKRIKIRKLHGVFGTFDPTNGQIEIDSKLTKFNIPSKRFVYWHEVFHKWILDNNIKLPPGREEMFCDYYALIKCRATELSLMERQLKKLFINKYGKNITEEQILKINLKEFK